jgi:hypothetical protein
MGSFSAYAEKAMLDWVFGGATPTQPAVRYGAFSLGTPTSVSGSEVTGDAGYARQSIGFAAAASPVGSASNTAFVTFGPFSSSNTIQGFMLYDSSATGAGNMLTYGTLQTARTVFPGDLLVLNPGALIITLG